MGSLCDMFTKLFFETTNPKTNYLRLFSLDVVLSIVLHITFYLAIICGLFCLFNMKLNKGFYYKATFSLTIIMILGYLGRLSRVKSIYKYLVNNGYNEKESINKSMELLHKGYFTYYFLG